MTCCPCCEPLAWLCRLALLLTLGGAIAFSIFSLSTCEFMYSDANSSSSFIGLFLYPDETGVCQLYPSGTNFDSYTETARACGALAAAIGFGTFIILLWESICCQIPCAKILETMALLVATVCQGLTFMIFGSEELCQGLTLSTLTNFNITDTITDSIKTGDFSSPDFQKVLDEYACQMGKSGALSITAMGLFGISMLVNCFSWRPEPCMAK
mmetsp:Transcript_13973/g.17598  ORF Transcript_13973/g.17598 Transcript_13973/m.17598 type:complete len:212 (+) Transcript_13973:19-654(+)